MTGRDTDTASEGATPGADRLHEWSETRPLWGGVTLVAGGGVLAWLAAHAAGIPLFETLPAMTVAAAAAGLTALLGVVALAVPRLAPGVGAASAGTAAVAATGVLASQSTNGLLAVAVGFAIALTGALWCFAWTPDGGARRARRRGGVAAVAVSAALLLLVTSASAPVAAGQFPYQNDTGGFVVYSGTLDVDSYEYQPNCKRPFNETWTCSDFPESDTSTSDGQQMARQFLQGVTIGDPIIYKNFQTANGPVSVSLTGTQLSASGDDGFLGFGKGYAVDTYITEFYSDALDARVLGLTADQISYWSCTPELDEGSGTIDDERLGINIPSLATLSLANGENVILNAHQLGSTESVITDFELSVRNERRADIDVGQSTPPSCTQDKPVRNKPLDICAVGGGGLADLFGVDCSDGPDPDDTTTNTTSDTNTTTNTTGGSATARAPPQGRVQP